ncbi:MAG TPA: phosphatase PAP2 family protein [Candidatus Aquilonibacter sp.]
MSAQQRLSVLSIGLSALVVSSLLGIQLDHAPDPGWLMFSETQWVNHGAAIAWPLTWLCWIYVLAPLAILLLLAAVRWPAWRSRNIFAVVSLLVAWQAADFFQRVFARPRRPDWIIRHETAFSYPSSHATIVTAFYLLLAVFVARSTLPGRAWISSLLALLSVAIMWSRLALGAHYLTDIVGGGLLGIGVVALLAACWPTNVFEGPSHASLE